MGLRWINANETSGSFPGTDLENDWLLMSGGLVVGRVFPAMAGSGLPRWNWALIDPSSPKESGACAHGDALGRNEAMAALLASWRRWQQWAGMQDA